MLRKRAITLVELLVVIALITAVMVILLPVLQASRETAKQGRILSTIRQAQIAVNLYMNDLSVDLPPENVENAKAYAGASLFDVDLPFSKELHSMKASDECPYFGDWVYIRYAMRGKNAEDWYTKLHVPQNTIPMLASMSMLGFDHVPAQLVYNGKTTGTGYDLKCGTKETPVQGGSFTASFSDGHAKTFRFRTGGGIVFNYNQLFDKAGLGINYGNKIK